jgi:type IV secretory pathway VirJ component
MNHHFFGGRREKEKILSIMALFLVVFSSFSLALEESFSFGRCGKVTVYSSAPNPSRVVLFISGDGGWNLGVIYMAKSLATLEALVVGIDINQFLKALANSAETCSYPAADLENLSKFVQKKYNFATYAPPILVGYSSGATFVYAAMVQAPSNTFRGAISLGFCPDLALSKPFCRGSGLEWKMGSKPTEYIFLPAPSLEMPWLVLQGDIDQVCSPASTEAYVKQITNAEIIMLPRVGHGFSVQKNWMPQFKQAFSKIFEREDKEIPPQVEQLQDLPLVEVAAKESGKKTLAVHMTGDGGWGVTDKGIARILANNGIPVVGVNSLKYFWKRRTPEGASRDLERILRHYLAAWKKESVAAIGYSLGADVLPFMINRLPDDLRSKISSVTLLGPSKTVEFQFHLTDWLGGHPGKDALPVLPEVEKLYGIPLLCFYGEDDKECLCHDVDQSRVKGILLQAGHRFGRNFESIAAAILKETK